MKTFKNLEPGDKVYFIEARTGEVHISEVKEVNCNKKSLEIILLPIIGSRDLLRFGISYNFDKVYYEGVYKIYTYESEFLKELSKYEKF